MAGGGGKSRGPRLTYLTRVSISFEMFDNFSPDELEDPNPLAGANFDGTSCSMGCIRGEAYCPPRLRKALSCGVGRNGMTVCQGPCEVVQRNCFGRFDPVVANGTQQILVFPTGFTNPDFNGDHPPHPQGYLHLLQNEEAVAGLGSETGGLLSTFGPVVKVVVRPTAPSTPQIGIVPAPDFPGGWQGALPLRYGEVITFSFGGYPAARYQGDTRDADICVLRQPAFGPRVLNNGCLLSRPWRIHSAGGLVAPGELVRFGDLFVLSDAYDLAEGGTKYLRHGGCPGAGWCLGIYSNATSMMLEDTLQPGTWRMPNRSCIFQEAVGNPDGGPLRPVAQFVPETAPQSAEPFRRQPGTGDVLFAPSPNAATLVTPGLSPGQSFLVSGPLPEGPFTIMPPPAASDPVSFSLPDGDRSLAKVPSTGRRRPAAQEPKPGSPQTGWLVAGLLAAALVGGGAWYLATRRSAEPASDLLPVVDKPGAAEGE